jgi:hypothetical protein
LETEKLWEAALQEHGPHALTQAAVDLLGNDGALGVLRSKVIAAAEELAKLRQGRHPVVYAVRVEPEWFGDS